MTKKISAVYKIVNTVTGDFYVGSSKNVLRRWMEHKRLSAWNQCPNKPLYKDMQLYGTDKFKFQILAPVMEEHLKDVEQEFIEMLCPTYNMMNAKGWDVERIKETCRKSSRAYHQTEKGKEAMIKANKKYYNRPCLYNGETLTLSTLAMRFSRAGIEHPVLEAKKYLIGGDR